jgi:hypothetical protein
VRPPELVEVDPFDLPEWLGEQPVLWEAEQGVREGFLVHGRLSGDGGTQPCDLLAVDEAYPTPVADAAGRARAHQAWRHGQVLLVEYDGRLALAVPGTRFTADGILDALARLARAVGAPAGNVSAVLRLGC